jgi:hypothetical protein
MPVTVVDTYPDGTANGGCCYVCGAAQRTVDGGVLERVVDLGITIEYEGHLLACESCITEAARGLGMLTHGEVEALVESVAFKDAEIASLEKRAHEAEEAFEAIRRHDYGAGSAAVSWASGGNGTPDNDKESEVGKNEEYDKNNAVTPADVQDTAQDWDHAAAPAQGTVERAPEGLADGGPPKGENADDAPTQITKAKMDERGVEVKVPEPQADPEKRALRDGGTPPPAEDKAPAKKATRATKAAKKS